jgi:hypothetical protein
MHLPLYFYFEIVCFLIAVIQSKKLAAFSLAMFIPLLFLVCLTEWLAFMVMKEGWKNNYLIYNVYLLLSTPMQGYLFFTMLKPKSVKNIIFWILFALLLLFILINFISIQGRNIFNTFSIIAIMLFNIFFCCIILLKYALVEDSMYHFFKTPYFWISSGLLIFSLATLVVLGLQNYILSHRVQIQQINVYRIVMPIANIVLYSAYSYAFILCRPHQLKQPFS